MTGGAAEPVDAGPAGHGAAGPAALYDDTALSRPGGTLPNTHLHGPRLGGEGHQTQLKGE